jgi:hypothetical protein
MLKVAGSAVAVGWIFAAGTLGGCRTAKLTDAAQSVIADRAPPAANCRRLQMVTGRGGGVGGAYISNEELLEHALNDARNKAAAMGGNYVHYDPPQLGSHEGTTTTVTITGTVYQCDQNAPVPAATATVTANQTEPPRTAGGFTLGESSEQSQATCTAAGHQWTAASPSAFFCSGSAAELGVAATLGLAYCENRLCAIEILVQPPSTDGKAWSDPYIALRGGLASKYGRAQLMDSVVPEACNQTPVQCLENQSMRVRYEWHWPTGEQVTLTLGKRPTGEGPLGIRVLYTHRPAPKSSVNANAL